jgi:hypothetical protein
VHATLHGQAARFERDFDAGWYEGVSLEIGADSGAFRARTSMPYYRLLAEHGVENGFGDLDAKVEWRLVRNDAWSLGPGVTAIFPTGSAENELGMGHTMLGGSFFGAWEPDDWFLGAEASYAAAIGWGPDGEQGSAHMHHTAAEHAETVASGPIPNPMSPYELALAASVGKRLLPALRLTLGALGAVPTTESGSPRVTLMPAVVFELGDVSSTVGAEVDLTGSTLRRIASFAVTARF